jgi:dCMP deaminase
LTIKIYYSTLYVNIEDKRMSNYSRKTTEPYRDYISAPDVEVDENDIPSAYKKELIFLEIATSVSKNSKDNNTQVGAAIVDKNGKVASLGYNGAVSGISDAHIPHSREDMELRLNKKYCDVCSPMFDGMVGKIELNHGDGSLDMPFAANKYPFMIHAEQNAIIHCSELDRLEGATIYITAYPCHVCTNLIAQKKISRIVVKNSTVNSLPPEELLKSLYILEQSRIELVTYTEVEP